MLRILLAALSALLTARALTPAAGRFALRVGALDRPGEARRIHDRPIPRMGGLAVFAGLCLGLGFFPAEARRILPGAALVTLLGAVDDRYDLPPEAKLLGQSVSAAAAILGGVEIRFLTVFSLPAALPRPVGILLTVVWIVGMSNALNLLDGLDGLSAGVTAVGCACTLWVCCACPGCASAAGVMAALGGACLGFLPYNRHPARIFLGDAGSLLLGYTVGCAAVLGPCKAYTALSFALPLLIWALPILDTALAVVRRFRRGESPFRADRRHVHHRLLDAGFSQPEAAAVLCLVSAALGLGAVLLASPPPQKPGAAGLMLAAASLAWRRAWQPLRRRKTAEA